MKLFTEDELNKEFLIDSNIEGFRTAKKKILEIASKMFMKKGKIEEIIICVDEIISNCIIHAYKGTTGKIYIRFNIDESIFCISIKDYGVGIPNKYTKGIFKLEENLLKESGRGLFIVNSLCDKLIINKYSGTEVIIYFEREGPYVS